MEDEKPQNSGEIVERDKDGKFIEGHPKLGGKEKGSKNYLTLLENAIKDYETRTSKKLFNRLIERAFINDNVLLNVIKKFIPDKLRQEFEGLEGVEITIKHDNGKSRS